MKVNLVIPAKGHSTRLKNKNLCQIHGMTLIEIACKKALRCKNVDNVYLDTESDEIIASVKSLIPEGLNIIKRPKALATNDIGANELLIYAVHAMEECDLIVQSFATSPMIKVSTMDRLIEDFVNCNDGHTSFFSVVEMQEYFWKNNKPINFDIEELPNSFMLEKIEMESHGLYGIYAEELLRCKTRVSSNTKLMPISKLEALDINDKEDIEILERVYSNDIFQ